MTPTTPPNPNVPSREGLGRLLDSVRFVGRGLVGIIHYLYLSRVSLTGLLVLIALPASLFTGARSLLLGAYDIQSSGAAVLVALALSALSGSIYITARIVWQQSKARFGLDLAKYAPYLRNGWLFLLSVSILLNAVMILSASARPLFSSLMTGLSAGLLLAGLANRGLDAAERQMHEGRARKWLLTKFLRLGFKAEPGYIVLKQDESTDEQLADGHAAALVYGAFLLAGYLSLIHFEIPALVALLILVSLCVFYLAPVTFFFDRYRVPLLLSILVYCMAMMGWRANDHYYRIWGSTEPRSEKARPAQVVARAMQANRPLVVVASAGGGIQAAAWTTAALNRIGEELAGYDFPGSVRLISGVSGGSLGALFYARAFDSSESNRFVTMDKAVQESSLGKAMRAMLRADLRRALLPFTVYDIPWVGMSLYDDRADALELAWTTNADRALGVSSSLREATLSRWGADALELKRPALIFNSTIVETGERMAFSTIPTTNSGPGKCEFQKRYQAEIAMTTAARLSATFPLISPTARPAVSRGPTGPGLAIPGPEFRSIFPRGGNFLHLVDGGYYENSGIVGAVEWLDNAFQELSSRGEKLPEEVLFLELNAFPQGKSVQDPEIPATDFLPADAGLSSQGTLFDLASPLQTIMNVRNSGQKAFAGQLLSMFKARWKFRSDGTNTLSGVDIQHVPIYYTVTGTSPLTHSESRFFMGVDTNTQPLSWHLRACEKNDISNRLVNLKTTGAFTNILRFFERHQPQKTLSHAP